MQIQGVLPVVHTPFLEDDFIDDRSLERQVEWAFEQGADGISTGMVSELLRLTDEERLSLLAILGELTQDRGVFIASVGAESARQGVEYAVSAQRNGADAVMAIPPVSTPISDEQQFDYFSTLARSVDVPVIVQDASAYVGRAIPMSVYQELIQTFGPEKILFKPEAAPLGPNLSLLRDATDGQARIFEGSGGIGLVDAYRRGIAGTIPGMDLLPGIVALWKALEAGDEQRIYHLSFPITSIVALQLQAGLDGFLAIEKYILHRRGLISNVRRRGPYAWSLDDETAREVDRLLDQLEVALAG